MLQITLHNWSYPVITVIILVAVTLRWMLMMSVVAAVAAEDTLLVPGGCGAHFGPVAYYDKWQWAA